MFVIDDNSSFYLRKGDKGMVIRKATTQEIQQIFDLSPKVMQEATLGYVKPDKSVAEKMIVPFIENGGCYLVYEEKKMILGWVAIGWQTDIYTEAPVGVILELYVFPPYRNRNIAKKLCLTAMEYMKHTGVEKVQLNVFAGNKAKQLYEQLGFFEVSTWMEKDI